MQVWNMLHGARWKYRMQKWRKNRHLRTIAHICRAESSQRRHVSTIGKNVLNSDMFVSWLLQFAATIAQLSPTVTETNVHCLNHVNSASSGRLIVISMLSSSATSQRLTLTLPDHCLRPYYVESTGSRPITEVKQRRARLVLGWVTAWEYRVL